VYTIHNSVSPGADGHVLLLLLLLSARPEIRRQNGRPTSRGGVVGDRFICVVVVLLLYGGPACQNNVFENRNVRRNVPSNGRRCDIRTTVERRVPRRRPRTCGNAPSHRHTTLIYEIIVLPLQVRVCAGPSLILCPGSGIIYIYITVYRAPPPPQRPKTTAIDDRIELI